MEKPKGVIQFEQLRLENKLTERGCDLLRWCEHLETELTKTKAQIPSELKNRTIMFRECEKGHGRLTATNWIDHGCKTCRTSKLEKELNKKTKRLSEFRKAMEWMANQLCTNAPEDNVGREVCRENDDCITEYCLSCYARTVLAAEAVSKEDKKEGKNV